MEERTWPTSIDTTNERGCVPRNWLVAQINACHVDLLTQLLGERQLGLNVIHIDEHLDEVTEDSSSSKQARRLLRALKEVWSETMGRSGVYPEYVREGLSGTSVPVRHPKR